MKKKFPLDLDGKRVTMFLSNPDFTTAQRVAERINGFMGSGTAKAVDSGTIMLEIPARRQCYICQKSKPRRQA